jgi:hypothetical protein
MAAPWLLDADPAKSAFRAPVFEEGLHLIVELQPNADRLDPVAAA